MAALACGGLARRYLLEFGEASSTYQFTRPNAALHLAAFTGISSLSWRYAAKQSRKSA
ncbi:hypothetical protein [uncultured Oscillibacter sp.]|nr:hypothetical protein [uncultured Oscillibacter sp.]